MFVVLSNYLVGANCYIIQLCAHLAGGLEDLWAERHDGTQHRQEPEDEQDAWGLNPVQPLKLDQKCGQELRVDRNGENNSVRGWEAMS